MHVNTVLIVDDDPAMRESLAVLLEDRSFSIDTAGDGKSALRLAEDKVYDVAVVDLFMPGLSGMDTIRRLKHLAPDRFHCQTL